MDFIMNSKQFTESTTSGAIASVSTPVGKTQTRGKGVYPNEKGGNLLTGKKTNKKFANSVKESNEQSVAEAKLDEEDIIIVPGQGKKYKQGFIPKSKDRTDHEVEMALSDLFQSAKNAKQVYELIKDIPEEVGIEGWVQEKIIKANDYLNTVREYLEHKQLSEETIAGKQDNFTIADIKALEQIRDLETIKDKARELIKGKPDRRMKPEKIDYFYNRIDTLTSPMKVIKLMYDLLLAGEGMKTIGNRYSTRSNSYQQRFNEAGERSALRYEMMLGSGKVKRFVAKDDADAKRIAASAGAKSLIKLKADGISFKNKLAEQDVEEGYRILPNIDRERYQEREGLEGPFRARNGKVYYYDPKAGMAYDPDTDFYIDYDELKMMDQDTVAEGKVAGAVGALALLAALGINMPSGKDTPLGKELASAAQAGDRVAAYHLKNLDLYVDADDQRTLTNLKIAYLDDSNRPDVKAYLANKATPTQNSGDRMRESSIMKGIQNEQSSDKRDFKRSEMEHELGHETNNYAVMIDGKIWKVFADKRQAENIARSLRNKGKKASVSLTGASVSESKNESVTENTDQEHDSASLQKHFGTEVAYDAASHGPEMMQRKDLKGNLYQLTRLPNKNYKATLVTESTDKCPECGGKLVAEDQLTDRKSVV